VKSVTSTITSARSAMAGQQDISVEIEKIHADAHVGETQPRLDSPPYRSSLLRHPTKDLRHADPEGAELVAPVFGHWDVDPLEADLNIQHGGEPIGERIVVRGRIVDGDGCPVRHQLVEIWQANAAGRYVHKRDQHPAPVDPNFTGVGRCLTDADGWYSFTTILVASYDHDLSEHEWLLGYRWDIVLIGSHATRMECPEDTHA